MNLKEAYEQAVNGDLLKREKWPRSDAIYKEGVIDRDIAMFSAMADDWVVIPVRKKQVSFQAWTDSLENFTYQCMPSERSFVKAWMSDTWKASAENTHLLYADLIKIVERYLELSKTYWPSSELKPVKDSMISAIDKIHTALTEAQS